MDGWWTQRDVQENWLNCSFNADLNKEPEVFVWSGVRIVTLTTTAASLTIEQKCLPPRCDPLQAAESSQTRTARQPASDPTDSCSFSVAPSEREARLMNLSAPVTPA